MLHLNAGNETGGGMYYLIRTLSMLNKQYPNQFVLGVLEKKELFARAQNKGIPIINFNLGRSFNPNALRQIIQFIKEENITHVHTHGPRANVLFCILRKFISTKWIITVHSDPTMDFKNTSWKRYLYTSLHLHSIKKADQIISVCRSFYPVFLNSGVDSSKLNTIHNGIDFNKKITFSLEELNEIKQRKGFNSRDILFIQVARLEYIKGHQYTLEALAKLIDTGYKQVQLLLIGDGTFRGYLEKLTRELNIERYVHFLGEKNNNEVMRLFRLADVTILSSISESFPFVLLESAREKKPVITTNVGDIKHLIKSPNIGWLIESQNSNALKCAMEEAIKAKLTGRLEVMGENFYQYVSRNFTLEKCVQSIYRIYRKASTTNLRF